MREGESDRKTSKCGRHCLLFPSIALSPLPPPPRFSLVPMFFLFSDLSPPPPRFPQLHNQAYEELGKLGEGTYGTVLRCRHKGTGELVAVKRFKESGEENHVSLPFFFGGGERGLVER